MRVTLIPPKGRLRERIEIELDEGEARAVHNGVEVKEAKGTTWIVVKPSKNFLEKLRTKGPAKSKKTAKS